MLIEYAAPLLGDAPAQDIPRLELGWGVELGLGTDDFNRLIFNFDQPLNWEEPALGPDDLHVNLAAAPPPAAGNRYVDPEYLNLFNFERASAPVPAPAPGPGTDDLDGSPQLTNASSSKERPSPPTPRSASVPAPEFDPGADEVNDKSAIEYSWDVWQEPEPVLGVDALGDELELGLEDEEMFRPLMSYLKEVEAREQAEAMARADP